MKRVPLRISIWCLLTIAAQAAAQSQPGSIDPLVISDVAEVSWSQARVLEGQQVRLAVRLTHLVSYEPTWEAPPFEGFHAERLPSEGGFMEHDAAGRPVRTTLFFRALFPARSGELQVPSSTILLQDRRGNQARVPVPAAQLRVDPVPPEGRPAKFAGLVGEISVRLTTEEQRVPLDSAFAMSFDILGTANLGDIPPFDFAALLGSDVEVFADAPVVARTLRQRELITRRHVSLSVVPTKPGIFEIPSLELPYFDTTFLRYRTARSEPLRIRVEPGLPRGTSSTPESTRSKAHAQSVERGPIWTRGLAAGALLLVGAGVVGISVYRRKMVSDEDDTDDSASSRGSPHAAADGMRGALVAPALPARDSSAWLQEAECAGAPEARLAALREAMRAQLCQRHGPVALSWTTADLVASAADSEAVAIMRMLDHARFASSSEAAAPLEQFIEAVRAHLQRDSARG